MDNWRDYFNYHKKSEKIEDMYQAFKARMEAEAHGEILCYTPEELRMKEELEEEEQNRANYEKGCFYRKRHAKEKGYEYRHYEYDPKRRYK